MIRTFNVAEIEKRIGAAIMQLRKVRGYNRLELAKLLNISHQQLAKYENGTNRITAGKLYILSQIMNVSLDYFFSEMNTPVVQAASSYSSDREQIDFAKYFSSINNPRKREVVRNIAKLFAEDAPSIAG